MLNQIFKRTTNNLKDKFMNEVNKERSKHADSIIRNHILFSMGAGIIPFPVVDVFAVSAAQLDMIRQLCRVYDVDFAETQGKAIVSSLTTATLARVGAGSLAKLIPVVGSLVGGITNSALAGASTFALGEVFKAHFETGGTILDFDTDRLKKMYKEKFEKGKRVAEEMRHQQEKKKQAMEDVAKEMDIVEPVPMEKTNKDSAINKLKELGELKATGIINDEEFERMKKSILDEF
ncbi:MAG: DUF697 domain-containing protein [Bacteroidetes bacterium]|jgi:uncharacterized protein (DUF697 family)|nr:DUF697 domain-containing protein [Bacteroidota bacterium]